MNRILSMIILVGALLGISASVWAVPGPTHVQAEDGAHADYVTVTWDSVPGATGYLLYKAYTNNPSAAFIWGNAPAGQNFQWDFTNVISGTPFYYFVKATGPWGVSDFSSADFGYAIGNVNPSDGLTAYPYSGHTVFDWLPPTGGIWYYKIYRTTDPSLGGCTEYQERVFGNGPTGRTYWMDTTAVPGQTYYYSVRTVSASQQAACSPVLSYTVQ